MGLARILLFIALTYLLYSIVKRVFLVNKESRHQNQFNRTHNSPQKPEGHITVEKPPNKNRMNDDDFVDYEEIK